jgi:hypothetical protein
VKVCDLLLNRNALAIPPLAHPLGLCCDNCIREKNRGHRFESIYDLVGFIDTSYGREPVSCPVGDDDSDLESTGSPKDWGNLRTGSRLAIRRRVLEAWRYECWKRDYRLCSWGPVGVLPDVILSNLASFTEVKTVGDLLEAVPTWGYASKYGHEVLSLLKDADREYQLESEA